MDKNLEIVKKPIEKVGGNIKKEAWFAVIESLATVILGIFLIAWPTVAIKVVSYAIERYKDTEKQHNDRQN